MNNAERNLVSSALHSGKPLKSYIKKILAKVYVTVWNSFENVPEGILLYGDPKKQEDTAIVDIWSPEEDYYFKLKNKNHLQTGTIIEFVRKDEEPVKTVEAYSDEELEALLNEKFKKFFSLQNLLNETNSVALLFRIKNMAQDQERSDKIIKAIEARIAEVQQSEYKTMPQTIETEL